MAGKTTERGEGGKTRADLEGKEGKVGGVGRLQKKRFQIFLPPTLPKHADERRDKVVGFFYEKRGLSGCNG